jgi:hypothetical protein
VKERQADGSVAVVPQTYPHPGDFEDWCRARGGQWIEEYDVVDG